MVHLTNNSEIAISTVSINTFGANPARIDVLNIPPNETQLVKFTSRTFSGYSMTVKFINGSEYYTEERIALNGDHIIEYIGGKSSRYRYDWLSFLYDEDSKLRFLFQR